jgi:hypothetical protein
LILGGRTGGSEFLPRTAAYCISVLFQATTLLSLMKRPPLRAADEKVFFTYQPPNDLQFDQSEDMSVIVDVLFDEVVE